MRRLIQKTDTRCHECKKLFCCVNCRDSHEAKKHPRAKSDSDCELCSSKILPLKLLNDAKFLCHLVIRHLPLICVLCGQIYRTSLELENPGSCEFWAQERKGNCSVKAGGKIPTQATPSPIVKTVSCPAASRRDSPFSDSEFHSLQSFASPPELMRNTSTPMHVGVAGYRSNPQFDNKTPKLPAFFMKAPKTPTTATNTEITNESIVGGNRSSPSPSPSLAFYSATSQFLLNSRDSYTDNSSSQAARNSLGGETSSKSILRQSREDCGRYSAGFSNRNSGQILEVMEEQEEQLSINMDRTNVQDNIGVHSAILHAPAVASSTNNNRDSAKRVRFSDQHQVAVDSTAEAVSINEEFYEAEEIQEGERSDTENESEARIIRENEDNLDKENPSSASPSPSLEFYSTTSQFLLNSRDSNSDNSSSQAARNSLSGDTPLKSILSRSNEDSGTAGFSNRNSGKILEVMEEQEEQPLIDMEMTNVQDNIDAHSAILDTPASTSSTNNNRDSAQRVRCSDKHQAAVDSTAEAVSVNEEFYEAEETQEGETSESGNKSEARMIRENEDNSDKENSEGRNSGGPEDASRTSSTSKSPSTSSTTSTSSRVLMMVVVENGFELSTRDLMPLINSSLQKIEKETKTVGENSGSSMTEVSAVAAAHCQLKRTAISSSTDVVCRSVSSVDSYNASSTVDYYLTPPAGNPDSTSLSIPREDLGRKPVNVSTGNSIAGGILSAMGHVVRSAFRALPGGVNPAKSSPLKVAEESLTSSSGSSGSSQASLSGSSSGSFSTIATSLLRRPGKRTRDPMSDTIAAVHRREHRRNGNDNGSSPVAKRPRSWHRIRGRDPIARMRRDPAGNATRGVSSETQHFQQGSLSVGDTIIPLPSRAHQSTQTD